MSEPPAPSAVTDQSTVTGLLTAREHDQHPGLLFEDRRWTWAEKVRECRDRAAFLRSIRRPDEPFHIGLLLDNVPEFSFLLGGAALSGAVVVGLNTQRRGRGLAHDIELSDCQAVITEQRYREVLDEALRSPELGGAELGADRVFDVDTPEWQGIVDAVRGSDVEAVPANADDLLMLIFTSGTSGEPKAVRCTHGKIAYPGSMLAERLGLSTQDTAYLSMPLFHSNAILAGWSVGLAAGATLALRRKFSASGFLDDVRRFGATYLNYVGKPLSYVLATPERPDDADNPLRLVYGNEGARADIDRFRRRFGCEVVDGFGSTEGGVAISADPSAPAGALGRLTEEVSILDPATGQPCPVAQFDAHGQVANPDEAVGELVNTSGPGSFAGYYRDPESNAERLRGGMYWSGDLAYRDAEDFCYFIGRSGDWLRVDGENMGTAPIERVLVRHPSVVEAAVYAVPDPQVGDQIMAALVLRDGARLTPEDFASFLTTEHELGPKQVPRFVRLATELPRTSTHKIIKRELAKQRWDCPDPVWFRDGPELAYRPLAETPVS